MRRLGDAWDELVKEADLELLLVDMRLHMHLADVRMVREVVRKRPIVRLAGRQHDYFGIMDIPQRNQEVKYAWQGDAVPLRLWPYHHTSMFHGRALRLA